MIRDYVRIARPDHWFKNVFMIPGGLLGWLSCPPERPMVALVWAGVALVSACLVCSSNYSINECLDAAEDRQHPEKRFRPVAAGRVRRGGAYLQWFVLGAAGLALAWWVNRPFFLTAVALLVMGILYNVPPVRLKERPYIDVLSEAINNPIRLLLGWYAVGCFLVPPASLLLAYWMLGSFLMAAKRFAELRHIEGKCDPKSYRKSFGYYNTERLLTSLVFYTAAFAMFGGIFLIRYRVELIIGVPFIAGFMAMYLKLTFLENSPAMNPEGLYRNRPFVVYTFVTAIILIACLVIRVPWLSQLFEATIPTEF